MKYGATDAVDAAASRGRGDGVTAIVLGVLAVALAATVGFYGYTQWWKPRELAEQRAAAAQAARQTGINLASIDYRDVQKGIDRVLVGMTGDIRNQWATQAKILADTMAKTQSISQVQQVRAGVISMDGDSAEVMVAINATVTSPKVKQGSPRYHRFEMIMTRVGERWLVSKMGLVP
jgi:Mce-associated membrane protein